MQIRKISGKENETIDAVVSLHLNTFTGFFLTFMGRGFLKLLYRSYAEHRESGILAAFEEGKPVGFLAYSGNLSGLYQYMLRKRLIPFAWYAFGAFLRKPAVFMRLVRALLKPDEAERPEKYVELASIGVDPAMKSKGIGSRLIDELKAAVDFDEYAYITLETDAVNNDGANHFYKKNGFVIEREFETREGRRLFEYRYKR